MVAQWMHGVPIIFEVLFGALFAYAVIRLLLICVSPKTDDRIEEYFIRRAARQHFKFLMKRGYRLSHVHYDPHPLGGWHVQIDAPDGNLSLILAQEDPHLLAFGGLEDESRQQVSLEAMVYYLTHGQTFIGLSGIQTGPRESRAFGMIARTLRPYVDQIEDFSRHAKQKRQTELESSQKEYQTLLRSEWNKRIEKSRRR